MATQSIKVFVPSDTTARSVGADAVANAIVAAAADRCLDVQIIRNGSRGLYWLEPLVEVDIDGKRYAYGPVQANDVSGLFEAGFLTGGGHEKSLGATESLSYLAEQTRLTFARVGIIDPLSLDDYLEHGGYEGLGRAVKLEGAEIVSIVTDSGLRGRGGAAFPLSLIHI